MSVWRYRFAGLLFESTLQIPEWHAFSSGEDREPDVRIILEPDIQEPSPDDGQTAIRSDDYRLSVPSVGNFEVSRGRRIAVAPVAGADPGELRVFLLGSALAAVCCQRGLLLLHASVVRLAARTVALCGPVGSGKSTLAAALVSQGASFVCDDLGRFDVCAGRAVVYPSVPRLKLSAAAVETLGWSTDHLRRVHTRASKFHVPQVHLDPWSAVPLHAIYVLDWTEGPVTSRPLTGLQALRSLVNAATYRPRLLERMDRQAAHWQQCAALAAGARVHQLSRPRTWSAIREATEAIDRSS